MRAIIFTLLSTKIFALSVLPKKTQRVIEDKVSVKKSSTVKSSYVKFLENENKSLKKIANLRMSQPDIWENTDLFNVGDLLGGSLFFSVLSSNLESPILIIPENHPSLPDGSKILCKGQTKHKRVMVSCNKLVTPTFSVDINAVALDTDGSFGLRGEFYSGKEEYIAGVLASEFTKGVLSSQQSMVETPLGPVARINTRNQILSGLISTANETTELIREEMQTKEPKVFISKNKKVIIFFNDKVTSNETN